MHELTPIADLYRWS